MLDKEKLINRLDEFICCSCLEEDSNYCFICNESCEISINIKKEINNKEFDIDPIKEYEEKLIKKLDEYMAGTGENWGAKAVILSLHNLIKKGDFR